ncbi:hypothetical protein L3V83_06490 [Thiotrichales bacterium 19X7-9]|nr:hypothetical protein [Thiotrichales bacterium 19X7-9]
MNRTKVISNLFTCFLLASLPFSSFAINTNCKEIKTRVFDAHINIGQDKCYSLPARSNMVLCTVTERDTRPSKKPIDYETFIQVTQYYTGPDIPGASTFTQAIKYVGQRFFFPGTDSPDTMQVHFTFSKEWPSKVYAIGLSCKYHTYQV